MWLALVCLCPCVQESRDLTMNKGGGVPSKSVGSLPLMRGADVELLTRLMSA